MSEDISFFTALLEERGFSLTARQQEQFDIYYRELVAWNERMNLTGITEKSQVYLKHFYDSITLSFYVSMNDITSVADIGSGAGFPSVPLKIMFPHLKVTIIDSLNKRIQFLQSLTNELGLQNVTSMHARAEEAGRKEGFRDSYDLVTARAVARLNVLSEFCLPFVKKGGIFAAMKGMDPAEEIAEARKSLGLLNGALEKVESFQLPFEASNRHIITVRKTGATTAKYPRKPGMPLKEPIV